MKTLELRKFKIELPGVDEAGESLTQELSYKDLITSALKGIPQGGLDAIEMKKRLDVLDKLAEINDEKDKELSLDDVDVDTIASLVKEQRFMIVDRNFVDYQGYIAELQSKKGK